MSKVLQIIHLVFTNVSGTVTKIKLPPFVMRVRNMYVENTLWRKVLFVKNVMNYNILYLIITLYLYYTYYYHHHFIIFYFLYII